MDEAKPAEDIAPTIATALREGRRDDVLALLAGERNVQKRFDKVLAAARLAIPTRDVALIRAAWDFAEELVRRVGGPVVPPRIVAGLAAAMERSSRDPAVVAPALRASVHVNTRDRAMLDRWERAMGQLGHRDRRERLFGLQDEHPVLHHAAILALLDVAGAEALRERYAGRIAAFMEQPKVAALARLWAAHATAQPIGDADAAGAQEATPADIALFFALKSPARTLVMAQPANAATANALAHLGVDPLWQTWLSAFLTPDPAWSAYLDTAAFPSLEADRRVKELECFAGFQDRAVREGGLSVMDPFSGRMCQAIDSWQALGRNCYLFLGQDPFYLISGGSGSKALCLYIPRRELVLDFRSGLNRLLADATFSNTMSGVVSRLAQLHHLHNRALAEPPPQGPRKIVVAMQRAQNFAHHYWNYYTGLERLVLAGLAANVSRVQFASSEFFGPIERLYPEFAGRVETLTDQPSFDPCPFSREELLVTVGGYAIPRTLLERVRRAMRALPTPPGVADPDLHAGAWPVVWIGMRTGDKAWTNQENDIPALIRALHAAYPDLLVLLDGFSYPVGRDEITQQWTGAMETLRAVAERVRAASGMPDRVVDMVGNTLRESVLWAERVDAYIAPVGTTQHKIGWFTTAPGLIYLSRAKDEAAREDRLPGAWEAEGAALPRFVVGQAAGAGERRSHNDQRIHLDNMALDVDTIRAELMAMLPTRRPAGR